MTIHARGVHYCLASPHFRSTLQGLFGALHANMTLQESVLLMNLSLFNSLPHLCGIGGDAIIMYKKNGQIAVINGTGKTGSYQNSESYLMKGMAQVPRRGVYSTMVYGAPYAFDRFHHEARIDVEKVVDAVINKDLAFGVVPGDELNMIYTKSFHERNAHTVLHEWGTVLRGFGRVNQSLVETMRHISRCGFMDMYAGALGNRVFKQICDHDAVLYAERDFTHFSPNESVLRETTFHDSTVVCHGDNSPWSDLFLLLKIYELGAMRSEYYLTPSEMARIMPYVEQASIAHRSASGSLSADLEAVAKSIINQCQQCELPDKDIIQKQSHTVFSAGVNREGELVGIMNSLYTPLGALFEVEGTGILLSNRCFAFNQQIGERSFISNCAVKHTNNIVAVENDKYSFIIGTSGGPVQSQTLALLIKKIVSDGYTPERAIVAPRFAHLGKHAKTGKVMYLAEPGMQDAFFTITDNLSNKFGVVQIAGIEKKSGHLFSCADPRGVGTALGM